MRLLMSVGSQNLAAHSVDRLAMAVHDVVVLHDVFALVEVEAFDLFLGAFQAFANQAVLDRHIVADVQPVHDAGDSVAAENAHQIVLSTDKKLGHAGIALAAGATAQLVIDAA